MLSNDAVFKEASDAGFFDSSRTTHTNTHTFPDKHTLVRVTDL